MEHSLAMIAKMGPYFVAIPTEIGVLSINLGQLSQHNMEAKHKKLILS